MADHVRTRRIARWGAVVTAVVLIAACNLPATPPGRPTTGPGSDDHAISAPATATSVGDGDTGTRVWTYVPATLAEGTKAPVVVLLHGFELLAPEIYQGLIDHLTKQGVIVVFPQFNKGGFGILGDTDQNAMLDRAIAAVGVAFGQLGAKADRSRVYLFGHSLGGLLASVWTAKGGVAPAGIVLANPSTDAGSGIPDAIKGLVQLTPIAYAPLVPLTTAPTLVLTGDGDTIAPPAQSTGLYDLLTGAAARSVYELRGDSHGSPALTADHMASIQSQGIVPDVIMQAFGGVAHDDIADWRYYEAAIDQVLAGRTTFSFDMGSWSDGTPVTPVLRLR